ncbi:MAG: hypothetical protein HY901_11135 [Deltaproteobacteria bacterium]|nr:hypothetical protein [Deltaproteobacteria bacterium]
MATRIGKLIQNAMSNDRITQKEVKGLIQQAKANGTVSPSEKKELQKLIDTHADCFDAGAKKSLDALLSASPSGIDLSLSNKAKIESALTKAWEKGKFPAARSSVPGASKLPNFEVDCWPMKALSGDNANGIVYLDKAKSAVYVKLNLEKNLPWEGISTKSTRWYQFDASSLK